MRNKEVEIKLILEIFLKFKPKKKLSNKLKSFWVNDEARTHIPRCHKTYLNPLCLSLKDTSKL
ncbi:hypothetical protein C4F49_16545 [Sphingobacterium sp. KB22]|uniref:Uncharacterized protein n=1 Tax=Sphingobacterium hungaricum TaxID=2082723 RepID=A0A928YS24_9SPHI|nr:hypothetical protein [Sphingobacterium hungaricum]